MNQYFAAILIGLLAIKLSSMISEHLVPQTHLDKSVYIVANVEVEHKDTNAPPEPEKVPEITPLMAKASVDAGKKIFSKCSTCHGVDPKDPHRLGPNLWNVVGSKPASKEGYSYSDAMKKKEGVWDIEALNTYLNNPKGVVPGTKMSFLGLKNIQERADLIAYLMSLK